MKKKHFKAVELKYLDSETILKIREWRNQEFVKKNMYSQHEITQEEHLKYIDNIRNDNNRGLFVFYLDDEFLYLLFFECVYIKKNNIIYYY